MNKHSTFNIKQLLFVFLWLGLFAIAATMCSCQTVQYVPIETVKTEIVTNTDTVQITRHDSVFIHVKGDTVWVERYKYIDRWRTKENIVQRTDSVPYAVEVVKEINVLTAWQRWQIGAFWAVVVCVLLLVAWKIIKIIRNCH